jgi:hypothetical protein
MADLFGPRVFAVVVNTPDGARVVDTASSAKQAVTKARAVARSHEINKIVFQAASKPEEKVEARRAANPESPQDYARRIRLATETRLFQCGLRPLTEDEVMSISVEQAHDTVAYIFADAGNVYHDIAEAVHDRKEPERAAKEGREIRPYNKRPEAGHAWAQTPNNMTKPFDGLLRPNFKTAKIDERSGWGPASTLGLTLVPSRSVFMGKAENEKRTAMPLPAVVGQLGSGLDVTPAKHDTSLVLDPYNPRSPRLAATLCPDATKECREGCLVFSGQNASSEATVIKQAAAIALLRHPREFVRLLVAACHQYIYASRLTAPKTKVEGEDEIWTGGTDEEAKNLKSNNISHFQRYIRLNVLSDIPWEAFVPWMFKLFPSSNETINPQKVKRNGVSEIQFGSFYDYGKGPDRDPSVYGIDNYDLTFSYSGNNAQRCVSELARGRRVAIPFIPVEGYERPKGVRKDEYPFPQFLNVGGRMIPVVDGDASDVRPRDPAGVIVGLRWKFSEGHGRQQMIERYYDPTTGKWRHGFTLPGRMSGRLWGGPVHGLPGDSEVRILSAHEINPHAVMDPAGRMFVALAETPLTTPGARDAWGADQG